MMLCYSKAFLRRCHVKQNLSSSYSCLSSSSSSLPVLTNNNVNKDGNGNGNGNGNSNGNGNGMPMTQKKFLSKDFSTKTKESPPFVHVHVHQTSASPAPEPTPEPTAPPAPPAKNSSPFANLAAAETEAVTVTVTKEGASKDSTSKPDSSSSKSTSISQADHEININEVQTRDYEHSYLPGILLSKQNPKNMDTEMDMDMDMQQCYFALRAFHIEIASIRLNENEQNPSGGIGGFGSSSNLGVLRMRWWKQSLNYLYQEEEKAEVEEKVELEEKHVHTSACGGGGGCGSKKKKSRASSGNVGSNPTIRSLQHVVRRQKLSRHLFETMIDARMEDIQNNNNDDGGSVDGNDNFNSMEEMIDFYSKTTSSLLLLHLECCGVSLFPDQNNDNDNDTQMMKEVVDSIGVGIGIINSIRSVNTGQTGIPKSLIRKYNINTDDINDPRAIITNDTEEGEHSRVAIQNAVKEMTIVAKQYLYHARLHQSVIPKGDASHSLLSVVSALRYLEKLEKVNYDVFDESVRDVENVESLDGRLWRLGGMFYLWRAWLTGVF